LAGISIPVGRRLAAKTTATHRPQIYDLKRLKLAEALTMVFVLRT
jgi:hypothetical protein